MARPKGNDWLEDEIKNLKKQEVTYLVSLLERNEDFELGIDKEEHFCKMHGVNFIQYSIEDRSIPKDSGSFIKLVDQLDDALLNDNKIVIHCRMGIGRSSLLAASILIKNGIKRDEVFKLISKYRTLNVPDTQKQINYIMNLELKPNSKSLKL
ncbi:MAG: dual specificity protein phosphatase family protein [Bacteroidetes bacterium]|nr:dual specificity protein phosphatase family protein [Bacteroidota bacterium]